jgi:hypothetical protein
MKNEILSDHAALCARAARTMPRTALTVTTRHSEGGLLEQGPQRLQQGYGSPLSEIRASPC